MEGAGCRLIASQLLWCGFIALMMPTLFCFFALQRGLHHTNFNRQQTQLHNKSTTFYVGFADYPATADDHLSLINAASGTACVLTSHHQCYPSPPLLLPMLCEFVIPTLVTAAAPGPKPASPNNSLTSLQLSLARLDLVASLYATKCARI